jgi:cytochrome b
MQIRVWDLPLRVFHWLLALSVLGSLVTVKLGEMQAHGWFGLFAISLLVFRLLWGVWGSRHAQFRTFVVSPSTTLRYLRAPWRALGHNPLGSWSILALIGLFLVQSLSGLGTSDDIFYDGPLVKHLTSAWVSTMGRVHTATEPVIYGLVGLHVAAVLYHRVVRREELLMAMLHGDKHLPFGSLPLGSTTETIPARDFLV